jgi:tetratricopeptide (TPR) repeat protein
MFRILTGTLLFLVCSSFLFAQSIPEKMEQGLARYEAGDVGEARRIFSEIIQENPNHGPARLLLGQIALEQGNLREAEEHLKTATESNPRRIQLAWQLLGKVRILQGSYESAAQALNKSLELTPPDAPQREETRLLLLALNSRPESKNELKVAVGENLGSPSAYVALGFRLYREGQKRKAIPLLQISSELNPREPVSRFILNKLNVKTESGNASLADINARLSESRNYVKEENWKEAIRVAGEITRQRPFHIPAHLMVIEAAEKMKDYWLALAHYRLILPWLSEIPVIQSRLAILARDVEAYDLAECSVRKAIEIQPQDGSLYYLLGTILAKRGQTDPAVDACKKAIELGYVQAPVYVTLGNLYYEKMDMSDSIAALGKAIEADPRSAENIAAFALSALTTRDYEALRNILEKHIASNPENVNTLYGLGTMYLNEGELSKAQDAFLRLEELEPDHAQVFYNLAMIYSREGNAPEASKAMQRFQQLKKKEQEEWLKYNQAYTIRTHAEDAAKAGNYRMSLSLYTQLLDSGTIQKDDLLQAGNAAAKIPDAQAAYSWYERALKAAPFNRQALEGLRKSAESLGKKEEASVYKIRVDLLSPDCVSQRSS